MFTRCLVYHVASGQAFFSGAGVMLVAIGLLTRGRGRPGRRIGLLAACIGVILVAVSATPMSPWIDLGLGVATLLWFIGEVAGGLTPPIAKVLRIGAALAWVAAMLVEAPYHFRPDVPELGRPVLGIVGDSVTAGMGDPTTATWPRILADRHGVEVRDHAVAGADVASALSQVAAISDEENLVLLEIGGNDILGRTSPKRFEAGLEKLLAAVSRPGRVVVMLELPLPPFDNAYGRIQRRLARRFKTRLVPKRLLLGVLTGRGTTLDSIHLSREGHGRMADAIWDVIRPAY
ncbi:SGNH/GDSL hydrolase family protein [Singulisphaera sp. PoT]|uniref:SGNH/GDSL hydrolase family protein n=1 Tax=Singulisphaera sp. PoT TaxID=3411797 RepID=UPI003BF58219